MSVLIPVKTNKFSMPAVGLIVFTVLFFRFCLPHNNPITFDVFGYYLYLPFTFIYHDLGLRNIDQLRQIMDMYEPSHALYQAVKGPEGFWVMKYSMGMSLMYAPFFFLSHLIALLSDHYPADGFSLPYQWGIIVGSTLYTLLGIFVLRKVLLKFFSDKLTAITLLLLFFGTNYFDQSLFNAEISHNYLFTLYALILWYTIRWHKEYKRKQVVLMAVFIGILILARPTEIIVLFIPLLWGVYNWNNLKEKLQLFRQYKSQIFLFVLILFLMGSLQLIYWKIYSGSFLYYSYTNAGEGLDFLSPHTFQTLFSFRKGWFVYTPLMFFAVWGFYYLYQYKRSVFFSLFIFFILNLYLVSSWSCWWYANCFSQRALVQSYAVMAIPLGFFVQRMLKSAVVFKWMFFLLASGLIVLNLFQTWQMKNNILSGDRMTYAYYMQVFGKTEISPEDQKLLLVNRWLEGDEQLKDESGYTNRLLTVFDFEQPQGKYLSYHKNDNTHSGNYSFQFDSSLLYFNLYKTEFKALTSCDHGWIRVSFFVFPFSNIKQKDFSLVIQFSYKGKAYKYRTFNVLPSPEYKTLEAGKWNKLTFDYLTPEVRSEKDELNIYFWNKGRGKVRIDDVHIRIFEPGK